MNQQYSKVRWIEIGDGGTGAGSEGIPKRHEKITTGSHANQNIFTLRNTRQKKHTSS